MSTVEVRCYLVWETDDAIKIDVDDGGEDIWVNKDKASYVENKDGSITLTVSESYAKLKGLDDYVN